MSIRQFVNHLATHILLLSITMKHAHPHPLNLSLAATLARTHHGVPIVRRTHYTPQRIVPFNRIFTVRRTDCGVHFFLHDYQFERLWNEPLRYLTRLSKFCCIFAPDFSLYVDMPEPVKRWNIYRNRLIGAWLQANGLTVIPTISWAETASFDYCFDGIEPHGTVAISTVGCRQNFNARKMWAKGTHEMIRRLQPTNILIYGEKIEFDFKQIPTIYYSNEITERLHNYDRKRKEI